MQRYFIQLSYNGNGFHGWQRQDNAHTIQQEIEEKLAVILQKTTQIVGCGRTDAEVHAKQYFAHFEAEIKMDLALWTHKLNCMLPNEIAIQKIREVEADAHARFDALARSYEYHIAKRKDPFNVKLVFEYTKELDVNLMNDCAQLLLEVNDFKSFCKAGSDAKTTLCDVRIAEWKETDDRFVFYITADRFLRNMVRAVVGTLLAVGKGKLTKDEFKLIMEAKNRSNAGSSAPASGLYLTQINYPKNIFI
jgi:tRNA pseudouridine38-40 synthase